MKTTAISFKTTRIESNLIGRIAQRAVSMAEKQQVDYDYMTATMDVTACHANGMKLDLQKLIDADDFTFSHDVFGIANHINRDTGKIERLFVPRCSAH